MLHFCVPQTSLLKICELTWKCQKGANIFIIMQASFGCSVNIYTKEVPSHICFRFYLPQVQWCWFNLSHWRAEKGWIMTCFIFWPHMPAMSVMSLILRPLGTRWQPSGSRFCHFLVLIFLFSVDFFFNKQEEKPRAKLLCLFQRHILHQDVCWGWQLSKGGLGMCEPNDFFWLNLRVFTFWFDRESIIPGNFLVCYY